MSIAGGKPLFEESRFTEMPLKQMQQYFLTPNYKISILIVMCYLVFTVQTLFVFSLVLLRRCSERADLQDAGSIFTLAGFCARQADCNQNPLPAIS